MEPQNKKQKQQKLTNQKAQIKLIDQEEQLKCHLKSSKVLTRHNMDKITSFNRFDVKGIIRLQFLQEKHKQLMTSYRVSPNVRKFSNSRSSANKFDMIIPSFQAFNISQDSLMGINEDVVQKVRNNRPKTQSKNFRFKKRASVAQSFNITAKHIQQQQQIQNDQTPPKFQLFSKRSEQLSKQFYSQLHRNQRRPSQLKFRSKNVQNIIRRRISSSFAQSMQQYCRRMKIQKNSRIFIFQSSDIWIKQALLSKGWMMNPDPTSKLFHLKWTSKISAEKANKDQLINHFYDSDLLTSKEGLAKVARKSKFLSRQSPRSFDLGLEVKQFIVNFNQTQILCGLKKIVQQLIRNKLEPTQIIPIQQLQNQFQLMRASSNYECLQKQTQTLTLHIPYTVQLCAFCENMRSDIEQQARQQRNRLNEKSLKNLFNFSLLNPPYDQYAKSNVSTSKATKIHFHSNNINMYSSQSSFRKASHKLLQILYSYHKYFRQKLNTYQVEGDKNIWITKNRNSSKGIGISMSSNLQQLLKKVENKLVQKYIEDCALYKSIDGQNYKYDLRVWVLVTSFNPVIVYFYQYFYCRLCSQPYDLEKLNKIQSHLTNYSTNKQSYLNGPSKKSSIITHPEFLQMLATTLGLNIQQSKQNINSKLNKLIYETLAPYKNLIKSEPQCFQLYGFDLLVSKQMDFYLLEVNLSPACQVRNQWMATQVQNMSQGLLGIAQSTYGIEQARKIGWVSVNYQKLQN